VPATWLRGLDTVKYRDKTDRNQEKVQHGEIVIRSEADSIYLNARHAIKLEEPGLHRCCRISEENSRTTVV
jgi:D-hexose-6-phosphate mutarotase